MSLFNAYVALSGTGECEVSQEVPCAPYSALHVGGSAGLMVRVDTLRALKRTLSVCDREQLPLCSMGRGSQIVVDDEGFQGIILKLGSEFSRFHITEDQVLVAGAACLLSKIAEAARRNHLAGLIPTLGIPGTVGGALMSNVAFNAFHVSKPYLSKQALERGLPEKITLRSLVKDLVICTRAGSLERLGAAELSDECYERLQRDGSLILEASFQLYSLDETTQRSELDFFQKWIMNTQPFGSVYVGPVFEPVVLTERMQRRFAAMSTHKAELTTPASVFTWITDLPRTSRSFELSAQNLNCLVKKGEGTAAELKRFIDELTRTVALYTENPPRSTLRFVGGDSCG